MFSAWDFNQWLGSLLIVGVMFGIVLTFAALVYYFAAKIWGMESAVQEGTGLHESALETGSPTRRAA